MKTIFRYLAFVLGSSLIAIGHVQAASQITFYHHDALGSVIATSNENGYLQLTEEYQPYGEKIYQTEDASSGNEDWYTGKNYSEELDLTYFGARWYDAKQGRFLSMDPAPVSLASIHSFNRYHYANSNPYRYIDPDGEAPDDNVKRLFQIQSVPVHQRPIPTHNIGHTIELVTGSGMGGPGRIVNSQGLKASGETKSAEKGGLNLFKWGDKTSTKAAGWKEGDRFLHLPNKGSPKANWKQNSGRLREEMRQGNPIYDSYRDPATGQQIPTRGFLNAERQLLESRGWRYNSSTEAYHLPGN